MRKFFSSFLEVLEVALVAVVSVFLIRTFLVQPFLVSGESMAPNFSNGDYLLVDELTYRLRPPERGEVIVFRYPNDESTYFIKRLVGLPGETVQVKDGKVTIFNKLNPDGLSLQEAYLPPGTKTNSQGELTKLGSKEYFVLGDNRSASFDSRSWGVLKEKELVGLARFRLWPVNDFRAFAAPNYSK
ncbi:MAG: signal peptidase I [Candidatus Liptonbacteria bacterium]|nr:signal peptidase I [Candidatus Liptonbacteria bacterium]